MLVISVWSYDGGGADPTASTSAADRGGTARGTTTQAPPAALPTTAPDRTRLRNVGTGFCLDVRGEPRAGAGARLAECSETWTQQWTYEDDGRLRSAADPGLCLDSHADAGVVILGTCADEGTGRGDDVRYDVTGRGELVPRWQRQLALATAGGAPDADVVVKVRDGTQAQRWRTERVTDGSLPFAGVPPAGPVPVSGG